MLYLKPMITDPTTELSRVTCFVKRYEIRGVLGTFTNLNVNLGTVTIMEMIGSDVGMCFMFYFIIAAKLSNIIL